MSICKTDFDEAFDFVMKWEGGYVYDKDDPGGETKYGISKKAHPDLDIKKLTLRQAKKIYKEKYWDALSCGDQDWPMNIVLFDCGVNMGVNRARRFLLASKGRPDIFIDLRDAAYRNIAERFPKMKKFLKGWLNRTTALRKVAGVS